ncbi:Triosephosphate isomerase, chloroplastic, partial [Zea mays]
ALCKSADVVVAPPFIYIDQVKNSLTGRLRFLLRMCGLEKEEPTLEILEQLVDIGCQWVILGHSERNILLFIGKKAAYALSQNVKVIAYIGELLEEREAGKTFDVCFRQKKAFADSISNWADVVIAYESVWAIVTGKVATPEQAQEVHAAVRNWLKTNISHDVASSTRIIYGG